MLGLVAIYTAMTLATVISCVILISGFTPFRLRIEKNLTPPKERWSLTRITLLVGCCSVLAIGGAHLSTAGQPSPTDQGGRSQAAQARVGRGSPGSDPASGIPSPPQSIGLCSSFGDESDHSDISVNYPRPFSSVHNRFRVQGFANPAKGEAPWLLICVGGRWWIHGDQPLRIGKGDFASSAIYTVNADKSAYYPVCAVLISRRGQNKLLQLVRESAGSPRAASLVHPEGITQHQCVDVRFMPPSTS
jgi:hypothetical protein